MLLKRDGIYLKLIKAQDIQAVEGFPVLAKPKWKRLVLLYYIKFIEAKCLVFRSGECSVACSESLAQIKGGEIEGIDL